MKFCPNYAENRVFGEKTPFFSAKIAAFHMIFSRVRRGVNGYLFQEFAWKFVRLVQSWRLNQSSKLKVIFG
jgi:hypothetical protein